ncbi:MAG: hypothetical protein ACQEP3_00735 [Patescibacteria group bacterium]
MNKDILAIIIAVFVISGAIFLSGMVETNPEEPTNTPENNNEEVVEEEGSEELGELVDCLAENDLVIYGSATCPACQQLVASLGGEEAVDPVYVECTQEGTAEEQQECKDNAETGYVPEIQISGEVYEGARDPSTLGEQVGCEY